MDWETSTRLLTTEMNRSSRTDIDMAGIALINAMDYYKSFPFDFNHSFISVHFERGAEILPSHPQPISRPAMRTGMPYGLKRPILIQVSALVTSGDVQTGIDTFEYTPTGGNPLKQISVEEMAQLHQGVGNNRTTVAGYPEFWAWHTNGTVRIFPVPFTDMLVSIYYVGDAIRPRYRWGEINGEQTWVFEQLNLQPNGPLDEPGFWIWEELVGSFTNVWLTNAEPLIRAWARRELAMSMYGDAGAAQMYAATQRDQENRYHYELQSGMAGTNPRRLSTL